VVESDVHGVVKIGKASSCPIRKRKRGGEMHLGDPKNVGGTYVGTSLVEPDKEEVRKAIKICMGKEGMGKGERIRQHRCV